MGELQIRLLGRPQVVSDGIPRGPWTLQKSLALLAYLAIVVLVALFVPAVRDLEDLLPDHDRAPPLFVSHRGT